ncbi:uncharacterized protein PFL1_02159 [Pseudozyma flocculosa PF-1]|uniref:Uncharacterized protein n=1 Tax=Pseudozyma flocculosa TaxID=84751 RepID=A0A5C3FCI7_9BASI|nr:uncharacterized protein PFL1_02159 [Pseudozyma flocculosa PF-1]EPQ30042.1 hypothetical protein PFL1_02159 [Pseudozyma flocculosa PF-1]SPO41375.1 uncharacterized protein PSFLO_06857 [Pseudozyma flocculosa]
MHQPPSLSVPAAQQANRPEKTSHSSSHGRSPSPSPSTSTSASDSVGNSGEHGSGPGTGMQPGHASRPAKETACFLRRALRPSLDHRATSGSSDGKQHRFKALATPPPLHQQPHTPCNVTSALPWSDELGGVPPAPRGPSRAELNRSASSTSHLGRLYGTKPPPLVGTSEVLAGKRKAPDSTSDRSDRAKRCRQRLLTVAKKAARRIDLPAQATAGSSKLTKRALDRLSEEIRCEEDEAAMRESMPDWGKRPLQCRRASSESCITLEEVVERSHHSRWQQIKRRSSLTTASAYNDRFRFAPPDAADGHHHGLAQQPGPSLVPSSAVGATDDGRDDPLPQLSLLSATETAPVGWRCPSVNLRDAPAVSTFQPEQQRFWPLVDHQLDYTGARMLSAAMSGAISASSPAASAASSARKAVGHEPPRQSDGSRTVPATPSKATRAAPRTDSIVAADVVKEPPRRAETVHASTSSFSPSPHSDDPTVSSGSQFSKLECGGPSYKPAAYAWKRSISAGPGPVGSTVGKGAVPPSSTLASIMAYSRRQAAESRLSQMSQVGRGLEREASSSSESEGDCTPRQLRFNAIVAQAREGARKGAARPVGDDDMAITPDSDVGGEPLGAPAALSLGDLQPTKKVAGRSWAAVPSDYFGDWDASAQRARLA